MQYLSKVSIILSPFLVNKLTPIYLARCFNSPPGFHPPMAAARPVSWASGDWAWPWWRDWGRHVASTPHRWQSAACSGWDAAAAAIAPVAASSPAESPSAASPSRSASCCSCAPRSWCCAPTLDLVFENLQTKQPKTQRCQPVESMWRNIRMGLLYQNWVSIGAFWLEETAW